MRDELGEFVRRGGLERAQGHGGAPDDVIGAVAIVPRLGVEPTQYQLVGAHLAHLEKGDGVGAFANYLGMLDRVRALKPRLRDALADQLAQQAELADEAYYHLDARHTGGHGVPLDAVDVVVEACARLGDLDRAFATFGELERFGVRPGVSTYNAPAARVRQLARARLRPPAALRDGRGRGRRRRGDVRPPVLAPPDVGRAARRRGAPLRRVQGGGASCPSRART